MRVNKTSESQGKAASLWDKVMTLPQYLIPQHSLSVCMHHVTRSEIVWFKNAFIHFIIAKYKVNINEAAQTDLTSYKSFNAFFTRTLRDNARPIDQNQATVVSPVDGAISQLGLIEQGQIVQAKGRQYSVVELLGGDESLAQQFDGGQFSTIYLSPKDYHRIHMPLSGQLTKMRYIPGKLFSVSPRTARTVPALFARNERVVTVFETAQGPIVMVLVGAIFVGSMETVWQGMITPSYGKKIQEWNYTGDQAISLEKGEEMGRFNMGSTVVLLLPKVMAKFNRELTTETIVKMGQALT